MAVNESEEQGSFVARIVGGHWGIGTLIRHQRSQRKHGLYSYEDDVRSMRWKEKQVSGSKRTNSCVFEQ